MTNFDVNTIKTLLENGASVDSIAKEMTDALNQAQKEHEAEVAKKASEAKATKVRADLVEAMRNYFKTVCPELMNVCGKEDWDELDKLMLESMNELETCLRSIMPLLKATSTATTPTLSRIKEPTVEKLSPINSFLKEYGLL